ncbi:hypothetical protein L2D08_06970 [Domibacillus sp. PGB-M46]|uniref:hypothetical protein n=1 Tax=Domibacillus sp. PGB-M46 TaxID=2910255 RepID=UPI001F594FE2|nr:hypothetical protein [Domibacillus sp. PGB-M46]MCI2254103.1 hypothetical protein [Domibacillus sp. PGB-M46]
MIINNKLSRKRIYQILASILVIAAIVFGIRPDDAMLGFWGGIIGGIAGGLFTYFGVKQTLNFEMNKSKIDALPQKILHSDSLISKLDEVANKIFLFRSDLIHVKTEKELQKQKTEKLDFLHSAETELKNLAVHINGEAYRNLDKAFSILIERVYGLTAYVEDYEDKGSAKESLEFLDSVPDDVRPYVLDFDRDYKILKEIIEAEALTFDWVKERVGERLDDMVVELEDLDGSLRKLKNKFIQELK